MYCPPSEEALQLLKSIVTFGKSLNRNKTKNVVFSKKKYKTIVVFKIYGQAIDLQDSYSYLGVIFKYNGNFCTARKKLLDQANKALYDQCKL